jgi:hypothetical protein
MAAPKAPRIPPFQYSSPSPCNKVTSGNCSATASLVPSLLASSSTKTSGATPGTRWARSERRQASVRSLRLCAAITAAMRVPP